MCQVSNVIDFYYDKWRNPNLPYNPIIPPSYPYNPGPDPSTPTPPYYPTPIIPTVPLPYPMPSKDEIDEFRILLDKARKHDKENGEKDCGIEEKKVRFRKLAKELGIDVTFIDEKG